MSIKAHTFAMQYRIPRPRAGNFHAVDLDMTIEAKMPRRNP